MRTKKAVPYFGPEKGCLHACEGRSLWLGKRQAGDNRYKKWRKGRFQKHPRKTRRVTGPKGQSPCLEKSSMLVPNSLENCVTRNL